MLNDKYGFIDKKGEKVILLKYDKARDFSEGLATALLNGKYVFIDKTGKTVIPFIFNMLYDGVFVNGLSLVELIGRLIYIDKTGAEVNEL